MKILLFRRPAMIIKINSLWAPLTVLTLAVLGIQARGQETFAPAPVRVLDTHGSSNEADWTVVAGRPVGLNHDHIVLENGLVRIAHPPTFHSEKAGHVLFINIDGKYQLAGDPHMGDWTYVGSSFFDAPTNFEILENSAEVARVRFTFGNHVHEYQDNAALPVKKTIVLHRGAHGYRAVFDIPSAMSGEREVGFGGTTTHIFSYSSKLGILWNPRRPPQTQEDDDVWLRDASQPDGDWWGASLAFSKSFYRTVSVRQSHLGGLRTGQYKAGNTGNLIQWVYEGFSRYEAFVAAVPYDGRWARRVAARRGLANVRVPEDGTYSLYTRAVVGRRHTYVPVKTGLQLKAGVNRVNVKGVPFRAGIVVPVSNGVDFPEDISAQYRQGRFD
jgi:hypothetical protein